MVTLLLILMMACNLWVLLYLTWERKESRKADGKDGIEPAREPLPDVIGKSRFSMPETKPQTATPTPNAATEMQSEAVDEKDVTFADEMETAGSHSAETKPSRQVPDEDLDEVFRDNRVHDTDGEFDGEPPEASGNTFDEIDRAARAVKDPKAGKADILQAGKVFHELEGTEFYDMFRRNNARYEARVSEMVETYLTSIQPAEKKTRMKAAVRKEYENFNIRDYV
jgi:hypothetical protein